MRICLAPTPAIPAVALIATAVSQTEIDLVASYPGIPFPVTYNFEFSDNGTTWTAIAPQKSPAYADKTLIASQTRSYRVRVQLDGVRLTGYSVVASATTAPTAQVAGNRLKFNPSPAYWQIDYNISLSQQFARMAALKSACPATMGFEFSWPWALLENPSLVGGSAQYDGSWNFGNDQSQINNLRGYALLDAFLAEATRLGCQLMMSIRCLGGHSDGGDQSPTRFPTSFVPTYFGNSTYGPNTASSNGRWGAVWLNSYGGSNNPPAGTPNTGNGSAFTMYVRWWDPLVAPLYKAFAAGYAKYDPNPNLECLSWSSDEMIAATTTGISDAGFIATTTGANGINAVWRAAFPHTQVRDYVSFATALNTMDTVLADSVSRAIAIGGPDTANDSPYTDSNLVLNSDGISRSITAAWRWKGLTASKGSGGIQDSTAPIYVGKGCYMCEVEGEDLAYDAFTGNTYSGDGRKIGDGVLQHIVAEAILLGAQYIIWYDNTDTTGAQSQRPAHPPLSSRITTVGAHPNLCDYVQALATGTTVQGITPGITFPIAGYPPTYPGSQ